MTHQGDSRNKNYLAHSNKKPAILLGRFIQITFSIKTIKKGYSTMDISLPTMLSITPIYIAILGLMLVPMTLYVGAYRVKNKVDLGDNGDKDLIRRLLFC
jgi:hypothetical protein